MRSMSLEKRTPDAPRCGSVLPNALCIFQRTRSCALASVKKRRQGEGSQARYRELHKADRHVELLPG